jgi:hypothetical protein
VLTLVGCPCVLVVVPDVWPPAAGLRIVWMPYDAGNRWISRPAPSSRARRQQCTCQLAVSTPLILRSQASGQVHCCAFRSSRARAPQNLGYSWGRRTESTAALRGSLKWRRRRRHFFSVLGRSPRLAFSEHSPAARIASPGRSKADDHEITGIPTTFPYGSQVCLSVRQMEEKTRCRHRESWSGDRRRWSSSSRAELTCGRPHWHWGAGTGMLIALSPPPATGRVAARADRSTSARSRRSREDVIASESAAGRCLVPGRRLRSLLGQGKQGTEGAGIPVATMTRVHGVHVTWIFCSSGVHSEVNQVHPHATTGLGRSRVPSQKTGMN